MIKPSRRKISFCSSFIHWWWKSSTKLWLHQFHLYIEGCVFFVLCVCIFSLPVQIFLKFTIISSPCLASQSGVCTCKLHPTNWPVTHFEMWPSGICSWVTWVFPVLIYCTFFMSPKMSSTRWLLYFLFWYSTIIMMRHTKLINSLMYYFFPFWNWQVKSFYCSFWEGKHKSPSLSCL